MAQSRHSTTLSLLGILLCLHAAVGAAEVPRAATSTVAQSVSSIMESTRAKVLASLARGDVPGAIAAYEVHAGHRAPEWLRALQTAFSAKSQEVGKCQEVARILHEAYSKLGKAPEFVAIQANNSRQYLAFDMPNGKVSYVTKNGYHAAVKVGDFIYDAFTGPLGMKQAEYFIRLKAPEGLTSKVVSSP